MKANMKLFFEFYKALLKSQMEYRFNFSIDMVINLFKYFVTYATIALLLKRFHHIGSWSYDQVLFLFTLNLLTYGIASAIFNNPMKSIGHLVHTGEFDSILIRPLNPFFHVMIKQYYLGFFAHVAMGLFLLVHSLLRLSVEWTLWKGTLLVLMIIGGSLIQSSVLIFSGTLSLKLVKAQGVMQLFNYKLRAFIDYPLEIYPPFIRIFLTFIVPYAFANFYPAQYLLGKPGLYFPTAVLPFITMVAGAVLFGASYLFFFRSIKSYTSTGT